MIHTYIVFNSMKNTSKYISYFKFTTYSNGTISYTFTNKQVFTIQMRIPYEETLVITSYHTRIIDKQMDIKTQRRIQPISEDMFKVPEVPVEWMSLYTVILLSNVKFYQLQKLYYIMYIHLLLFYFIIIFI